MQLPAHYKRDGIKEKEKSPIEKKVGKSRDDKMKNNGREKGYTGKNQKAKVDTVPEYPRRSTRGKRPVKRLELAHGGKSYGEKEEYLTDTTTEMETEDERCDEEICIDDTDTQSDDVVSDSEPQ